MRQPAVTTSKGICESRGSRENSSRRPRRGTSGDVAETGLHPDTLAQLLRRRWSAGGERHRPGGRAPTALFDLEVLIQHARVEKLVEVRGASGAGNAGYRYALTDLGAIGRCSFSRFHGMVGAAPVPLAQYNAYVLACMRRVRT